jgi:hypothetical protein
MPEPVCFGDEKRLETCWGIFQPGGEASIPGPSGKKQFQYAPKTNQWSCKKPIAGELQSV